MSELENILQKIVGTNSPSVQYIFFDSEKIIDRYSLGFADISANKHVNDKTTYNAYSITKTFTALAILQLSEQGKIDLEQPVKKYLPTFPYSAEISIRQLLSHSAGIPNPIPLNWIHLVSEHAYFDWKLFFKNIFDKKNKTRFSPNQKFSYSNLGYILLGELIEKISGSKYETYIDENIIQRLKLSKNELAFEIPDPDRHAKGYHKKASFTNLILGIFINKSKFMGKAEKGWKPFHNFYVNGVSYGGLIGTAGAFVKYSQQLLSSNNSLLSEAYKNFLFTENVTMNGKKSGMCLSWFTGTLNGIKYFTHAGGGGGYYCELRLYPEKQVGSVIFFNRTGMTDERFLDKVDILYFNK